MPVAAPPSVLMVDSPAQPVFDVIQRALHGRAIALERVDDAGKALDCLRQQQQLERLPAAVLIAPGDRWPLTIARQVREVASQVHLVFLTESGEEEPLRRSLLFEPLLGANWSIVSLCDTVRLGERIEEIALNAARRLDHQATLAVLNTRIASFHPPPLRERLVVAESHLATLLAFTDEAIFATDAVGRVVSWNSAAEHIFGIPAREAVGQELGMLLAAALEEPIDHPLQNLLDHVRQETEPVLLERSRGAAPAGSRRVDLELRLAPICGPNQEFRGILGRASDVTERKRRERALQAQYAVTRLLASAPALDETLPQVLSTICESLGWPWGELWEVDDQAEVLRCITVWYSDASSFNQFLEVTRACRFHRGEGLPGQVWASGEAAWMMDLVRSDHFIRREAAIQAGLRGAFGIPIQVKDQTVGVLCFLSRESEPPDEELLRGLTTVGQQIGQFTIRSRAEAALRESEERFRTAVASGCDLMYVWDIASDHLDWFGNVEQRLGLPSGEAPQTLTTWASLLHPDDYARVMAEVGSHLHTREPSQQEYRIRHQDGEYHYWSDRGSVVWDEDGQPQRWVGVIIDVTEEREAEARLRFLANVSEVLAESLEYDRILARLARLAIPFLADFCYVDMVDPDGRVRRVATAHVDPAQQDLLRELQARYTPDRDAPSPAGEVLRTGKTVFYPHVNDEIITAGTRDAEHAALVHRLQVSSHISVPMVARGTIIGVINLVRTQGRHYRPQDLQLAEELARRAGMAVDNARLYREARTLEAELRQRAEELARASQAKDVFLAMLAHELRNPLAPIQNAAEILRYRGNGDETLTQTRQVIERNVQHLARIVDDLLDVSRITRGTIELRIERVDLASVVEEALEISRPLIEERNHRLVVSMPSDPVKLEADPTRLSQIVANLLNNAAKYTGRGGHIWLTAERDGDQAVVRVRDSGIGIPAEMLPQVFELFTQVNPTLDRANGGLGLGLTLVKSLVELHGGTVEAHSAGLGHGSEFVIRLPALPANEGAREAGTDTGATRDQPPRSLCILLVDDNVDAATTLGEVLELWGHDVELAFDGRAALDRVSEIRPDVILLDIGLPGMDGYEVASRLREDDGSPRPLLVALTGYGQESDRRRAEAAGFDLHLVKPVKLDSLRAILADIAR